MRKTGNRYSHQPICGTWCRQVERLAIMGRRISNETSLSENKIFILQGCQTAAEKQYKR